MWKFLAKEWQPIQASRRTSSHKRFEDANCHTHPVYAGNMLVIYLGTANPRALAYSEFPRADLAGGDHLHCNLPQLPSLDSINDGIG